MTSAPIDGFYLRTQLALLALPFPRFPMSGPKTGHEGTQMRSMPGHRMIYNDELGREGVEIETPEGMLISFSSKHALERFIRENRVSIEDAAGLRAIDARADLLRSPHTWAPAERSWGM